MSDPPRVLRRIVRLIDHTIGEWSGRLFCWLILPMVVGLTYEVIVRKVFSAPTDWAYEATYMLYGSHFMLGVAYALHKGAHIRTDVLYNRWSVRTRGLVDATLYLVFFFPGMLFFLLSGGNEAVHSWLIGERSDASPLRPPIYPFKAVIPAMALLVLVQGVSEFLKSAYAARTGRALT
jgi:TRAP-type mannitol/chloroaromatic compound transport system permease small subunit